jgi:hypothetical protein
LNPRRDRKVDASSGNSLEPDDIVYSVYAAPDG